MNNYCLQHKIKLDLFVYTFIRLMEFIQLFDTTEADAICGTVVLFGRFAAEPSHKLCIHGMPSLRFKCHEPLTLRREATITIYSAFQTSNFNMIINNGTSDMFASILGNSEMKTPPSSAVVVEGLFVFDVLGICILRLGNQTTPTSANTAVL